MCIRDSYLHDLRYTRNGNENRLTLVMRAA